MKTVAIIGVSVGLSRSLARLVTAEVHPGPPLTGRPAEILALFADQPELTASDVAQATGLSRAMTQRHLARLVEEGRLVPTAPPSSRNRAYRLLPGAGVPPQCQGNSVL